MLFFKGYMYGYLKNQKIFSKLLAMVIWGIEAEEGSGVLEGFQIFIHICVEYIYNVQALFV